MTMSAQQPATAPTPSLWNQLCAWLKRPEGFFIVLGGVAAVGLLAFAASSGGRRRPALLSMRLPSLPQLPTPRPLHRDEQLAVNREAGAELEGRVGRKLKRDNPGKKLIPQVTVTTRSGRRRRPDYVLAHPNGSVRPVEVKNVPELTEGHVRQAEDHRDGLQSMGLRSGRPIVVVPASTVVREEHANRVEVVKIRKRARR